MLASNFPLVLFNTVEGAHLIYRVNFGSILQDTNRTRLNIRPTFRYSFSREKASGNVRFTLRSKNYRFQAEGGRYVQQFNLDEPILPVINTFMTLLFEENLMKIYEREFVDLSFSRNINQFITVRATASWAQRRELVNNSTFKLIDWKSVEGYTENRPINDEQRRVFFYAQ